MTDRFTPAAKILKEHQYDEAKLIPILQKVQDEYKYLPEDIMRFIANELEISPDKVFGVATFFAHFAITPKGKHIIKVCNGTACHVKGSSFVINTVKDKLKLKDGKCECCRCKQIKSIDEFVKSSKSSYGHTTVCLECERRRTREKYQRLYKR